MLNSFEEFIEVNGYKPRVFIADDQAVNIQLVHAIFKDDFTLFMAMDGAQALTKIKSTLPDLILLDVNMPKMDGHQVCMELKKDLTTRDIPVIFLTGQQDEKSEVLGLQLGAVDFIKKPINETILRVRVMTQLALKFQTDRLRTIATIDGLTGIANRRRFDETLKILWLQAIRSQQAISLMMIDVDYFKRYNDHYGHLEGDNCLQKVAGAIRQSIKRPQDLAARYGGEEFTCLLPDTELEGAVLIAQSICNAVSALGLEHAKAEGRQHVTISVGVATCRPLQGDASSGLIEAADQQLYRAKQSGRAQVCFTQLPAKS